MNKMLTLLGLLLFSGNLLAGTCTPATVSSSGGYSFSLTHISSPASITPPFFYAGRMVFNGSSSISLLVVESQAGFTRSVSLSGTYTLPSTCLLTVNFSLPASAQFSAKSFAVSVFLDRMDTVPSVNVAYHGNAVFRTNLGMSGVGVIDRSFGKF